MESFMRQTILTTVGALLFSTGLFAADAQLLNLVMPDAQVMAGLNVTSAKTSAFGQYLLTRIAARSGNQFDKLSAATGFDPRRDLTEVLAASPGNAGQKTGLVLAKGTFNVSQLTDAIAKDAAAKNGQGPQVTNYGGATLISGNGKENGAVAFLGTSIALAGDLNSVKAAIDRSTQTNSISPALSAKVQALSAAEDAWAVSLEPISALAPKALAGAAAGPGLQLNQVLNKIQAANGGVKFGSLIVLSAQATATDPASANALADVVRMLAGLLTMNAPKNAQAPQILQSLQVSTDGAILNVSLSVSESDAEQILKMGSPVQGRTRRGDQ
jgi:hypothetical protein